jgi:hypothetical protein
MINSEIHICGVEWRLHILCSEEWLKLRRNTLTPALINDSNIDAVLDAGPNVATIFVLFRFNGHVPVGNWGSVDRSMTNDDLRSNLGAPPLALEPDDGKPSPRVGAGAAMTTHEHTITDKRIIAERKWCTWSIPGGWGGGGLGWAAFTRGVGDATDEVATGNDGAEPVPLAVSIVGIGWDCCDDPQPIID